MASQNKGLVGVLRGMILTIVALALLLVGVAGSLYLMKTGPKAQRRRPEDTTTLVEAKLLQAESRQVAVSARGTVIAANEVTLQPQVSGEVTEIHPNFLEGGVVKAGEVLVRIEPRDYELAVVVQEEQLETARYEYKAEQGQQDVARREWELLAVKDASELDRELALRQPQLRQKKAGLRAAEASLEQARLDLERTAIKAPCNGIILEASVDVGDMATTQTTLGTLVGTDTYWVQASVPVDKLKWIVLPHGSGGAGSQARVYAGTGGVREGRVLSLLGDLEPEGRMARILVEVSDPLALGGGGVSNVLLLGEYVRVEIEGRRVDGVFAVARDALRDGHKVWLAGPDSTLQIRDAEIVWADEATALLRGLSDGERMIVSDIAAPVEGMALDVREGAAEGVEEVSQDVGAAAAEEAA